MTSPLESALSEFERRAEHWRVNAALLERVGAIYPAMQIRVCANDVLRITRALRAEHKLPENAGGSPPSPPCVTGRASSADDARPLSGGTQEKGGYAEARRQGV